MQTSRQILGSLPALDLIQRSDGVRDERLCVYSLLYYSVQTRDKLWDSKTRNHGSGALIM